MIIVNKLQLHRGIVKREVEKKDAVPILVEKPDPSIGYSGGTAKSVPPVKLVPAGKITSNAKHVATLGTTKKKGGASFVGGF